MCKTGLNAMSLCLYAFIVGNKWTQKPNKLKQSGSPTSTCTLQIHSQSAGVSEFCVCAETNTAQLYATQGGKEDGILKVGHNI